MAEDKLWKVPFEITIKGFVAVLAKDADEAETNVDEMSAVYFDDDGDNQIEYCESGDMRVRVTECPGTPTYGTPELLSEPPSEYGLDNSEES